MIVKMSIRYHINGGKIYCFKGKNGEGDLGYMVVKLLRAKVVMVKCFIFWFQR